MAVPSEKAIFIKVSAPGNLGSGSTEQKFIEFSWEKIRVEQVKWWILDDNKQDDIGGWVGFDIGKAQPKALVFPYKFPGVGAEVIWQSFAEIQQEGCKKQNGGKKHKKTVDKEDAASLSAVDVIVVADRANQKCRGDRIVKSRGLCGVGQVGIQNS